MTVKHVIIGKLIKRDNPPRCGSSAAHANCKFAVGELDCSATGNVYNDCPYRQIGSTIAVYEG